MRALKQSASEMIRNRVREDAAASLTLTLDWIQAVNRIYGSCTPRDLPGYFTFFPRAAFQNIESSRTPWFWSTLLLDAMNLDPLPILSGLFCISETRWKGIRDIGIESAEAMTNQLCSDDPGHKPVPPLKGLREGEVVAAHLPTGLALIETNSKTLFFRDMLKSQSPVRVALKGIEPDGTERGLIITTISDPVADLSPAQVRWYSQGAALAGRLFQVVEL